MSVGLILQIEIKIAPKLGFCTLFAVTPVNNQRKFKGAFEN